MIETLGVVPSDMLRRKFHEKNESAIYSGAFSGNQYFYEALLCLSWSVFAQNDFRKVALRRVLLGHTLRTDSNALRTLL